MKKTKKLKTKRVPWHVTLFAAGAFFLLIPALAGMTWDYFMFGAVLVACGAIYLIAGMRSGEKGAGNEQEATGDQDPGEDR